MKRDDYLYGCSKKEFLTPTEYAFFVLLKGKFIDRLEEEKEDIVMNKNLYESDTFVRFNKITEAIEFWDNL